MKGQPHPSPPLGLVVLGIVMIALPLRGPIVAITPVLDQVAADLGLGAGAAGLLGTLPVLAFAVASPLAAFTISRIGPEVATLLTFVGIFVSQLVRAIPTTATMFAGTVALGLTITLGNIVVPVVIQRDVPKGRVGAVTGIYAATMNVGSLLTALATAPLAEALGWPMALAVWSVLTAVCLAVWAVPTRLRAGSGPPWRAPRRRAPERSVDGPGETADSVPPAASRRATRIRATWLLSAAFSAQAFTYYAYTTWLPSYLSDTAGLAATGAGALASSFQAWGVVGGLLVPVLFRWIGLRGTTAAVGALWLTMSIGLVLAPGLIALWLGLGGIGQAGGFIVVFSAVALAARDSAETAGMSAVIQTLGYVVAASAGPAIGALREATGGWGVPMAALVATTALFTATALAAAFHVGADVRRRAAA
ncbi:MAG: MFS transporter [Intrasporangium sp.]|uniref:MFS transporter n=1 Tax=Intrasporangium sp. TaxID=1925024 RepID=UPI0026487725|nr:MFS transporter [Intrasporangium sp.]MDN5794372.1 MFS transporter [Intrasporangium sp.]